MILINLYIARRENRVKIFCLSFFPYLWIVSETFQSRDRFHSYPTNSRSMSSSRITINPMIRTSELYAVFAGRCISFVCSLSVNRSKPLKLQQSTTAKDSCQQVATRFSYIPPLSWANHITLNVNSYQNEALESVLATRERPNYAPNVNAHIEKRYLPWVQGRSVLTDGQQSGVSQCPEGPEQVLTSSLSRHCYFTGVDSHVLSWMIRHHLIRAMQLLMFSLSHLSTGSSEKSGHWYQLPLELGNLVNRYSEMYWGLRAHAVIVSLQ